MCSSKFKSLYLFKSNRGQILNSNCDLNFFLSFTLAKTHFLSSWAEPIFLLGPTSPADPTPFLPLPCSASTERLHCAQPALVPKPRCTQAKPVSRRARSDRIRTPRATPGRAVPHLKVLLTLAHALATLVPSCAIARPCVPRPR